MDPKDPTPAADNPADVVADAPVDPKAAGDGTAPQGDNPDPSKSTDSNAADGDKKPTAGEPGAGDPPAPLTLDNDLDAWIEKRGFPKPTTDAEKQAYQASRNEQREFTRQQQAAKSGKAANELDTTVKDAKDKLKPAADPDDADDPVEARIAAIEEDRNNERDLRLKSELYASEQVTTAEHDTIKTILMEKVDKAGTDAQKLAALDYWGAPAQLGDLLDIARARLAKGVDNSADIEKAAQEERERIAKESNASSPGRSATTPLSGDKTPDQERTERLKARYS
jgi:hypothetical protein